MPVNSSHMPRFEHSLSSFVPFVVSEITIAGEPVNEVISLLKSGRSPKTILTFKTKKKKVIFMKYCSNVMYGKKDIKIYIITLKKKSCWSVFRIEDDT